MTKTMIKKSLRAYISGRRWKLFLAFFLNLYYTIKAPAGVLELVDEEDSKTSSPSVAGIGKRLGESSVFQILFFICLSHPSCVSLQIPGDACLGNISAGVLELVDEADSKSVGLITRAGSTPATGTIFAPKCYASEHFLLLKSIILNIFWKRRKNCICRRDLTGKIQMCVDIGCCADIAVSQPFLNLLQAHTIGIE